MLELSNGTQNGWAPDRSDWKIKIKLERCPPFARPSRPTKLPKLDLSFN
jgi:hypothetical protein